MFKTFKNYLPIQKKKNQNYTILNLLVTFIIFRYDLSIIIISNSDTYK